MLSLFRYLCSIPTTTFEVKYYYYLPSCKLANLVPIDLPRSCQVSDRIPVLESRVQALSHFTMLTGFSNTFIKTEKSLCSHTQNKYLLRAFIKISKCILKLFAGNTYRIKKKNHCFSLNSIFVALDRSPKIAVDGGGPDIALSKSALADYNGPIKKGTTTIQTPVYKPSQTQLRMYFYLVLF